VDLDRPPLGAPVIVGVHHDEIGGSGEAAVNALPGSEDKLARGKA
jgi:hypothetical protein